MSSIVSRAQAPPPAVSSNRPGSAPLPGGSGGRDAPSGQGSSNGTRNITAGSSSSSSSSSSSIGSRSKPQQGYFMRVNVHQSSDFQLAVPAVALRVFADTTAEEVSE